MINPTPRSAVSCLAAFAAVSLLAAQDGGRPVYRTDVEMVVVNFAVADGKNKSVAGLKPTDVRIFEDGIEQRIAAFSEGSRSVLQPLDGASTAGTSVFILFDTSNRMYKGFPYVCDYIADFIRRLDPADAVALYTFSRNLSRAAPLTTDHLRARSGLTNAVAGDDTALFNSVLLTLRDAARAPSARKAVVVFSNGPDNASVVAPDDVATVAVNEGIPVYIVSTLDTGKDPVLARAFQSLTERTGGKLYFAPNSEKQSSAFTSVREDIASTYTAAYYPAPNPNEGFRSIRIEAVSPGGKAYRIRCRLGYQARKRHQTANN